MTRGHSSNRRHLAIWFPFLPIDRLGAARPEGPFALTDRSGNALRLVSVDARGCELGLVPGLSLADAHARVPGLVVWPHDTSADGAFLDQLVRAFGRFTPMVARDDPCGLMLDVTGCAHLFGGEAGLMTAVGSLCGRLGLQSSCALARTPQGARALSRFGRPGTVVAAGEDRAVLRRLPVTALELPPGEEQALRRAGLKTLGDVDHRPRASMAARFGQDFSTRLDRILGLEDARITPVRAPAPVIADRMLVEPLITTEPLETVLGDLLADVAARLEARLSGARRFRLTIFRIDGQVRQVGLSVARPTRDVRSLQRLFRERLAALTTPVDPGFGIDHLRLEARHLHRLDPVQVDLDATSNGGEALDGLIDRLAVRLGPEAIRRVRPGNSHLPERASQWTPALQPEATDGFPWPEREPRSPPLRPLHLFDPPQPIEAIALAPDSPPARFRWRRIDHRVTRAEGPERIEAEWWRRPGHRVRDYYRVEDEEGRRFWLFRAGSYGADPPPRWYVHGLFA